MSEGTPVLIIEDEPEIRKFLRVTLSQHGYKPAEAETGHDGLKQITAYPPDLVILDLGLPDMDGMEIIKEVRQWSALPIIVLSAREQERNKIEALELGADDYLTKPFSAGELLARLKVALRHSRKPEAQAQVFEHDGLKVDFERRQVFAQGKEIHLTPLEYKLLATLARHAGKVVTHRQLLAEVWGKNAAGQSNYLRIHTQHLRHKLGDDPVRSRYLVTEAGVGYRLKSD